MTKRKMMTYPQLDEVTKTNRNDIKQLKEDLKAIHKFLEEQKENE